MISSFDIDGVIFMGPGRGGVYPGPDDIIITGRSHEEADETLAMLKSKGINNRVVFNSLSYSEKTRESSGYHKAANINSINKGEVKIIQHYEDDPIQADIISKQCPGVDVILLMHDLVEKENVRHFEF